MSTQQAFMSVALSVVTIALIGAMVHQLAEKDGESAFVCGAGIALCMLAMAAVLKLLR